VEKYTASFYAGDHRLGLGQNTGRLAGITGSRMQLVSIFIWKTKEPHVHALSTLVSMRSVGRVKEDLHRIQAWRFQAGDCKWKDQSACRMVRSRINLECMSEYQAGVCLELRELRKRRPFLFDVSFQQLTLQRE
jgi:hypothetical protein